MKILISERQFKRILKEEDVLNEQNAPINQPITAQATNTQAPNVDLSVTNLQDKINQLIREKQEDALNKIPISLRGDSNHLTLRIGQKDYPMERTQRRDLFKHVFAPGELSVNVGKPLVELFPEIAKMPEYKELLTKYPNELPNTIQGLNADLRITPDGQNQPYFQYWVRQNLDNPEDEGLAKPYFKDDEQKNTSSLATFFANHNKLVYKISIGQNQHGKPAYGFGELTSGYLTMKLSNIALNLQSSQDGITKATPAEVKITPIDLGGLGDVFKFDDITFVNEAAVDQSVQEFIQQFITLQQKYGQQFVDYVKRQNPTILGYSSIDGNPADQIVGKFTGCPGKQPRLKYDQCLSQKRAQVIADKLNKALSKLGITFQSKGMGETNLFDKAGAWAQGNPTVPGQTFKNRRFVLNPFKEQFIPTGGQTGTQAVNQPTNQPVNQPIQKV
jgi:outer membrane protein OmpA-like peptidoglycan-associated protein